MQGKLLYEYAVIRIVPRVERCEFVNTGIILFCRDAAFLKMQYEINDQKIRTLHPEADVPKLRSLLEAFDRVCQGAPGAGTISQLKIPERFRWLTAQRSTMVQVSEVHPGLTADPEKKLRQLFRELVL